MTWYKYDEKVITIKDGDMLTVTDPCYDDDASCNTKVHLPVGEYDCFYEKENEGDWGFRIKRCAIAPRGTTPFWVENPDAKHLHDSVGVDAGLCGFFVNKPDYDDAAWEKFCDGLDFDTDVYHSPEGFFTSSGYGDGEYNVFLLDVHSGVGVMIEFISDYEDEDEDEDDWDYEDEDEDEDEE